VEFRPLGATGLRVSVLGLGTNAFGGRADAATSEAILHAAIDAGVTFIDTANGYTQGQSETILGQALKGRRHEVILATKAGLPMGPGPNDRGSSRYHLVRELEKSLRRLQTDYVDVFWVHTFDPGTPLEETLRALDDLVRAGKVRYVGASNYRAWELAKALGISDRYGFVRYQAVQPSYSLADRTPEQELIPLCRDQGLGLVAYFPLAGGILSGKYRPEAPPPSGSRADKDPNFARRLDRARLELAQGLAEVARELSATPAQVALAWLYGRPGMTSAIAGATRVEQLKENLGSLEVRIPPEVAARLEALSAPFVYGPPFAEFRLT
jgi:aryl-alcohol dehydrogenase-like predicted oxidoreductase